MQTRERDQQDTRTSHAEKQHEAFHRRPITVVFIHPSSWEYHPRFRPGGAAGGADAEFGVDRLLGEAKMPE